MELLGTLLHRIRTQFVESLDRLATSNVSRTNNIQKRAKKRSAALFALAVGVNLQFQCHFYIRLCRVCCPALRRVHCVPQRERV